MKRVVVSTESGWLRLIFKYGHLLFTVALLFMCLALAFFWLDKLVSSLLIFLIFLFALLNSAEIILCFSRDTIMTACFSDKTLATAFTAASAASVSLASVLASSSNSLTDILFWKRSDQYTSQKMSS